jgi:hypothetical protein
MQWDLVLNFAVTLLLIVWTITTLWAIHIILSFNDNNFMNPYL